MIILCQIVPHVGIVKRVMMQDGHYHEDHVGSLVVEWVGMGDTSGAFVQGKY